MSSTSTPSSVKSARVPAAVMASQGLSPLALPGSVRLNEYKSVATRTRSEIELDKALSTPFTPASATENDEEGAVPDCPSVVGTWDSSTAPRLDVSAPALSNEYETTNELTRRTRPEARYWKAPVTFTYAGVTEQEIRVDNVTVPFMPGQNYGESYVYIGLPTALRDRVTECLQSSGPFTPLEPSLASSPGVWWKAINNVSGTFGVVAQDNFRKKSLGSLLSKTKKGIMCSAILRFQVKASTDNTAPLSQSDTRRLAVVLVRAYIAEIDVDIQPPARATKKDSTKEPSPLEDDVASESLLHRLQVLGI